MFAQQVKRTLFLGNSYTAYNNLPNMTRSLALSLGDTLTIDSNTPGGWRLSNHSANATSTGKITGGGWDYVVLQEQSQVPALGGTFYQEFATHAAILDSIVKATDSCTQTMFYMTWGRKNGDGSNCQFIPEICTYDGMQLLLRNSYLQAAGTISAPTAPVGMVWRHIRNNYPAIELYNPDESHPSVAGSYVAACTFYASMFHSSPVGASYIAGLDSLTAVQIQTAAATIVFDSLDVWRIDTVAVHADFSFATDSLGSVTLVNNSEGTVQIWDLGDGNTTIGDTITHNYLAADSVYNITLYVEKLCKYDTLTQSVRVLFPQDSMPTGLSTYVGITCQVYPNPATDWLKVEASKPCYLKLYDSQGCLVLDRSEQFQTEYRLSEVANMPAGIYMLRLVSTDGSSFVKRICVSGE